MHSNADGGVCSEWKNEMDKTAEEIIKGNACFKTAWRILNHPAVNEHGFAELHGARGQASRDIRNKYGTTEMCFGMAVWYLNKLGYVERESSKNSRYRRTRLGTDVLNNLQKFAHEIREQQRSCQSRSKKKKEEQERRERTLFLENEQTRTVVPQPLQQTQPAQNGYTKDELMTLAIESKSFEAVQFVHSLS